MPVPSASSFSPPLVLPSLRFSELKNYDGLLNAKIYLSLLGIVYDVTKGREQFFGPGQAYSVFSGRDATYALSIMSLKKRDVDRFDFSKKDLDPDDLLTLAEWISYFDFVYGPAVFYLTEIPSTDGRYPVKLTDLPPVLSEKCLGVTRWGGRARSRGCYRGQQFTSDMMKNGHVKETFSAPSPELCCECHVRPRPVVMNSFGLC